MSRHEERLEQLIEEVLAWLRAIYKRLFQNATTAKIDYTEGNPMGTATLTFTDPLGNAQNAPTGDGSGLVVTFAATDPTVITFDTATVSGTTAVATGTRLTDAAFTLNATVANTSGAPLLDDDGVTAFQQPPAVDVPAVTPTAQATTGVITFSET